MRLKYIAVNRFSEVESVSISDGFRSILLDFMIKRISQHGDPSTLSLEFFNAIRKEFRELLLTHHPKLLATINAMAKGNTPYAIHISNTFIQDSTLKDDKRNTQIADAIGLAFSSLLGNDMGASPPSFGGEKMIMAIKPILDGSCSSSLTQRPLLFHIDNVNQTGKPDFLALACVQGNESVETGFLSNSFIVKKLDAKDIAKLKTSSYFDGYGKEVIYSPIIRKDGKGVHTYWYEDMALTVSKDGKKPSIVEKIETAIRNNTDSATYFTLKCGDILLMNNGSGIGNIAGGLHCRRGVFDNFDRELRRIYVKSSAYHA